MRQEKREQVIKAFTAPNKDAVAGSKADKKSPMVMLLSLKVRAGFFVQIYGEEQELICSIPSGVYRLVLSV